MRNEEASNEINKLIKVSHFEINLAKNYIYNYCFNNKGKRFESRIILKGFLDENRLVEPQTIIYEQNEDMVAKLTDAAKYFAFYLAGIDAIISLTHQGILCNDHSDAGWRPSLIYNFKGHSGGLQFSDCFDMHFPQRIFLSPQYQNERDVLLADHNLFILTLGIEGADAEIIDALKDAILCFQKSLFRPALTMLGKAMEGAWIELGISLAKAVYVTDETKKNKFVSEMQDAIIPTNQKIKKVIDLYKNRDLSKDIITKAEIHPSELENIITWSDILRDARNAIHFGVKPTFPNNYEKTAVLLLGAAKNIPKIYHIKNICDRRILI
jgi:hypothetical protein